MGRCIDHPHCSYPCPIVLAQLSAGHANGDVNHSMALFVNEIGCMMPENECDRAVRLQVARLSARLKEREGQLSEAEDCYRKLDDLYQAEKSDHAAALACKVWL